VRWQIHRSLLVEVLNLDFNVILQLLRRKLKDSSAELVTHVYEVSYLEVTVFIGPLLRSTERAFECVRVLDAEFFEHHHSPS
jgi:hypothetical protein